MQHLAKEIGPEDEVIVGSDGSHAEVTNCMLALADERFSLVVYPKAPLGKGNGIRDRMMTRAKGDWILFIDDDDAYVPGALEIVRTAVTDTYTPHLFAMRTPEGLILGNSLEGCMVGGPQFVLPNRPAKFGRWASHERGADHGFITGTLEHYGGECAIHQDVIYEVHGAEKLAHPAMTA